MWLRAAWAATIHLLNRSFSGNQHVGLEQTVVGLGFYHRELKLKHHKLGRGLDIVLTFFYSQAISGTSGRGQGRLLV